MTELARLGWEVEELTQLYGQLEPHQLELPVYPEWSVLDVLRHLVWWHESFAAVVQAAERGEAGDLPKGTLAEVNARSVAELSELGVRSLVRRLRAAQRLIDGCGLSTDRSLGYRRGSRRYTFNERIGISIGELNQHRRDVLQALLRHRR